MLRRPLFAVSICVVLGCYFGANAPATPLLVVLCLCAVAAAVFAVLHRRISAAKSVAALLMAFVLAGGYTLFLLSHTVAPIAALAGQTAQIAAKVTAPPDAQDSYVRLSVRVSSVAIADAPQQFDAYLYSDDGYAFEVGDQLCGTVQFKAVSDYRAEQYYAEGRYITATLTEIETVTRAGDDFSLSRMFAGMRAYLKQFFLGNLNPDEAALLCGITINDKSAFTDAMLDAFSRSGISHIVAVSGMHLSVLCGAMQSLLARFRLSVRICSLLMLFFVVFVVAAVGFPISAVRAGIMLALTLLGRIFFKRSDALTSLGVAAILILLFNPLAVLSLSFQLSFSATLGLIVLANPLDRAIRARTAGWRFFGKGIALVSPYFSVSLAASIFTLPFVVLQFGYAPLVAPLTNSFLLFTVSLAMIFALLAAVLAPIGFLSNLCLLIAGLAGKYILAVSRLFAKLSFATLSFEGVGMKLALAGCIALIAIPVLYNGLRRRRLTAVLLCICLLASAALCQQISAQSRVEVRTFQSESGICVAVRRGRACMLIGTGDRNSMLCANTYLQACNAQRFCCVLLPDTEDTFANAWNPLIHDGKYDMILAQGDGKYAAVFDSPRLHAVREPIDTLTPFDGVRVQMVRTAYGNGARVTVFQRTILIAPHNLPGERADVLICTAPQSQGIGDFEAVLVAGRGDTAALYAAALQQQTKLYIVDDASLSLTFNQDGHYTLRRMT